MQQFIGDEDFDLAVEIPELKRLKPEYQRFVWQWTHNGCSVSRAAASIGYSVNAGNSILKRQEVIDAITALTDRMLHSAAIPAILAVEEIVKDPLHKDRLKAAAMILNRTGWPEVQEHRVKVEKVPDEAAMMQAAIDLAKKLGIDPASLVGRTALQMIELQAEPLDPHSVDQPLIDFPEPLADGSDI